MQKHLLLSEKHTEITKITIQYSMFAFQNTGYKQQDHSFDMLGCMPMLVHYLALMASL